MRWDHPRVNSSSVRVLAAGSFVVLAILSAGAATYFLLAPSKPRTTTLPASEVGITPLYGGAAASWTKRF